jgi:hypothetical protein
VRRYIWMILVFLIIAFRVGLAAEKPSKETTVEEAYPGLASGILMGGENSRYEERGPPGFPGD